MSVYIEMLKTKIATLEQENKKLKDSHQEMKSDVSIISNEVKELIEQAGLTEIFTPKEGQLNIGTGDVVKIFGTGDVVKIFGKLTLKFTTGKIKISDLQARWEKLTPVLSKYSYLLENNE